MAEAADLLRLILLARAFFETADQQHQREHLDLVAWLGPLHRNLCDARQGRFCTRASRVSAKAHAGDEKQGEQKIAQERVAEKHPTWRRAELGQTNGERLNQARKILRVTGIGEPGERVGNRVKNCRSNNRSRQKRFKRNAVAQQKADEPDQSKREVATKNQRIDNRRTVMKVEHCVRDKKGDEWHGELVFRRKISGTTERKRGEGGEIGKPGRAGINQESRRNAIGDDGKNKKK